MTGRDPNCGQLKHPNRVAKHVLRINAKTCFSHAVIMTQLTIRANREATRIQSGMRYWNTQTHGNSTEAYQDQIRYSKLDQAKLVTHVWSQLLGIEWTREDLYSMEPVWNILSIFKSSCIWQQRAKCWDHIKPDAVGLCFKFQGGWKDAVAVNCCRMFAFCLHHCNWKCLK